MKALKSFFSPTQKGKLYRVGEQVHKDDLKAEYKLQARGFVQKSEKKPPPKKSKKEGKPTGTK